MNKFENFAVHWFLSEVDENLSYEGNQTTIKEGDASVWSVFEDFYYKEVCDLMDDMVWALEKDFK